SRKTSAIASCHRRDSSASRSRRSSSAPRRRDRSATRVHRISATSASTRAESVVASRNGTRGAWTSPLTPRSRPHPVEEKATMRELGLDTFGDVTFGASGERLPQHQVLRDVVEEAVLADRLGLSYFGVGEHHRDDFAVSAPEVVLAAIAGRTKTIHLGSAVTGPHLDGPRPGFPPLLPLAP